MSASNVVHPVLTPVSFPFQFLEAVIMNALGHGDDSK